MSSVRPWAIVTAAVVALLAAAVVALALTAAPASAFSQWQHDGAIGCASCHSQGTPTDATCQNCHTGFQSYPGDTCWTCHYPGQDTTSYWTTSPTPTASPTRVDNGDAHPDAHGDDFSLQPGMSPLELGAEGVRRPVHARHEPAPRVDQRLP